VRILASLSYEKLICVRNSWEGLTFAINDTALVDLAGQAADIGVQLFVMDDGWFGTKFPRNNDSLGLGDWSPNPEKFPEGLGPFVEQVVDIKTANTSEPIRFGIWVEPEMVNPKSTVYQEHPDWVLFSGNHGRTQVRSQLILNVGLPEVQDFIIDSVSRILDSANISYVKWDNNRGNTLFRMFNGVGLIPHRHAPTCPSIR
jgi:alpha-galactosidase